MATTAIVLFEAAITESAYEDTARFWRSVDDAGIPHQVLPAEDFGQTAIQITQDQILRLQELADQARGVLDVLI